MKKFSYLRYQLRCLQLGLLLFLLTLSAQASTKPNILLILADDLGYADVSFIAGKNALVATPSIDRIADEGVIIDRFYTCPVCSPTRVGTLTGRWPITMGLQRSVIAAWHDRGLEADVKTLPEILSENGYKNTACIGKWHLGASQKKYLPTRQGFSHFYGHYNGAIDYFEHTRHGEADWFRNDEPIQEEGYATDLLVDETIRYMQSSVEEEEPFFIYLPLNAPHSPFQAKEHDLEKFNHYEGTQRTYAAMVHSMDQGIGRILNTLDTLGVANDTLVLFYSDNGGVKKVSRNEPLSGGKFTVSEGGVRVCAAARWPNGGIDSRRLIESRPMGYIDVLPTICAAAGIDLSQYGDLPIDGENVLDVLRGQSEGPEREWFHYLFQSKRWDTRSVMEYPYKLVWIKHYDKAGALLKNMLELYDLEKDPFEKEDIADQHPDKVQSMQASMLAFLDREENPIPPYAQGKKGFTPPRNWVPLQ